MAEARQVPSATLRVGGVKVEASSPEAGPRAHAHGQYSLASTPGRGGRQRGSSRGAPHSSWGGASTSPVASGAAGGHRSAGVGSHRGMTASLKGKGSGSVVVDASAAGMRARARNTARRRLDALMPTSLDDAGAGGAPPPSPLRARPSTSPHQSPVFGTGSTWRSPRAGGHPAFAFSQPAGTDSNSSGGGGGRGGGGGGGGDGGRGQLRSRGVTVLRRTPKRSGKGRRGRIAFGSPAAGGGRSLGHGHSDSDPLAGTRNEAVSRFAFHPVPYTGPSAPSRRTGEEHVATFGPLGPATLSGSGGGSGSASAPSLPGVRRHRQRARTAGTGSRSRRRRPQARAQAPRGGPGGSGGGRARRGGAAESRDERLERAWLEEAEYIATATSGVGGAGVRPTTRGQSPTIVDLDVGRVSPATPPAAPVASATAAARPMSPLSGYLSEEPSDAVGPATGGAVGAVQPSPALPGGAMQSSGLDTTGTALYRGGSGAGDALAGTTTSLLSQTISSRRGLPKLNDGLGQASSDVSFLADTASASQTLFPDAGTTTAWLRAHEPVTVTRALGQTQEDVSKGIEPQYHLVRREFRVPERELDMGGWGFSAEEKLWVRTEFPARNPSGRRDAMLLSRWMNTMLRDVNAEYSTLVRAEEEKFAAAQVEVKRRMALANEAGGDVGGAAGGAGAGSGSGSDLESMSAAKEAERAARRAAVAAAAAVRDKARTEHDHRIRVIQQKSVASALVVFESAFREATRQVAVHCEQRGALLAAAWTEARDLWATKLVLVSEEHRVKTGSVEQKQKKAEGEAASLRKKIRKEAGSWKARNDELVSNCREQRARCAELTSQATRSAKECDRLREMLRQLLAQQLGLGKMGAGGGESGGGGGGGRHDAEGGIADIMAAAFGQEVHMKPALKVVRLRFKGVSKSVEVYTRMILRGDDRRSEFLNTWFEAEEFSDSEDEDELGDAPPSFDPTLKTGDARHKGPEVYGAGRAKNKPNDDDEFELGIEVARFSDILAYMHTGRILVEGMDALQELRSDAETLQMPTLEAACTERIHALREEIEAARKAEAEEAPETPLQLAEKEAERLSALNRTLLVKQARMVVVMNLTAQRLKNAMSHREEDKQLAAALELEVSRLTDTVDDKAKELDTTKTRFGEVENAMQQAVADMRILEHNNEILEVTNEKVTEELLNARKKLSATQRRSVAQQELLRDVAELQKLEARKRRRSESEGRQHRRRVSQLSVALDEKEAAFSDLAHSHSALEEEMAEVKRMLEAAEGALTGMGKRLSVVYSEVPGHFGGLEAEKATIETQTDWKDPEVTKVLGPPPQAATTSKKKAGGKVCPLLWRRAFCKLTFAAQKKRGLGGLRKVMASRRAVSATRRKKVDRRIPVPRRVCVRTIHQIYRDKLEMDNRDDGTGVKRQEFVTFLYEWYLNKYGLRRLAEAQIGKMLTSILKYRKSSPACKIFGQFLGMFEVLGRDCFNVYLDFLGVILSITQGSSFEATGGGGQSGKDDPESMTISVTAAVNAVTSLFGERMGLQPAELRVFTTTLNTVGKPDPTRGNTKFIGRDAFLALCVKEYLRLRGKTQNILGQLFVAGDVDGDGQLSLDEFSTIIQHIDGTIAEREVSTMYREAFSGDDVMKKEVFVQVCLNHGLMSYKSNKRFDLPPPPDEGDHFALLEATWSEGQSDVEQSIDSISDTATRKSVQERVLLLKQLLGLRQDAEAAWMCYRMIMMQIRKHVSRAVKNPLTRMQSAAQLMRAGALCGAKVSVFAKLRRAASSARDLTASKTTSVALLKSTGAKASSSGSLLERLKSSNMLGRGRAAHAAAADDDEGKGDDGGDGPSLAAVLGIKGAAEVVEEGEDDDEEGGEGEGEGDGGAGTGSEDADDDESGDDSGGDAEGDGGGGDDDGLQVDTAAASVSAEDEVMPELNSEMTILQRLNAVLAARRTSATMLSPSAAGGGSGPASGATTPTAAHRSQQVMQNVLYLSMNMGRMRRMVRRMLRRRRARKAARLAAEAGEEPPPVVDAPDSLQAMALAAAAAATPATTTPDATVAMPTASLPQ